MVNVRVLVLLVGMLLPGLCVPLAHAQEAARYGIGLRLRGLFVPERVFEQFVDIAPSGISKAGLGLEVIRRKRRFESTLGVAWSRLNTETGIWVNDDIDDNPHLVEFDDFGWITVDLTGVWRHAFDQQIALRYGMGVGLGFLIGDVLLTDYVCPPDRADRQNCRPRPNPEDFREPLDRPAIAPILTLLTGLQYTPSPDVLISVDAGLQTTLFVGLSVAYLFPR